MITNIEERLKVESDFYGKAKQREMRNSKEPRIGQLNY